MWFTIAVAITFSYISSMLNALNKVTKASYLEFNQSVYHHLVRDRYRKGVNIYIVTVLTFK